jgi:signal transduction histidine kinase
MVATRSILKLFALALLASPRALALPVKLHPVEATAPAQSGHPLDAAVDGIKAPENGWSLKEDQFSQQFAVFAADQPLAATMYQLRFSFLAPTLSHLRNFGVSVTTDENPTLKARWTPLLPEVAVANWSNQVKITGRTIHVEAGVPVVVVTIQARAPFLGITGFRLRLRPMPREGTSEPASAVGAAPDGNFLLTEFEVEAEPLRTSNIALGRQIFSSGAVPADLPKKNLTDGLISTYSCPDPSLKDKSFFFTLDLGRSVDLDHIVVRARVDGGDEARLGPYLIEVLSDDEDRPRSKVEWLAVMHADGGSVPLGGEDVIYARNGEGVFSGNSVRIHNRPGQWLAPQISELEVYPALKPRAQEWSADRAALPAQENVLLPAGIKEAGFTISATEPEIFAASLLYRWRIPGWSAQWHEVGPDGRVTLSPAPPAGAFALEVQARHSDGIWDGAGGRFPFRIAFPWWQNPSKLLVAGGVAVVIGALGWWRFLAWRLKRRLALAERHLELHRERLRIARDMHDEMGSRLTYIALLADRGQNHSGQANGEGDNLLSRVAENARAAVTALDDIVWAVNPQHDTVGSLADYLSDYAPAFLQAAGVECRLKIQVETNSRPLGLAVRHSLLMAVKESLQNVAKHARARLVCVDLLEQAGRLEISITDDGSGFPGETTSINQSGLENMKQRLAEIGGECGVTTAPDGGACVRFVLSSVAPA